MLVWNCGASSGFPMRRIEVDEGLTIRFPQRGAEFDEGVEIGLLAASLAAGRLRVACRISSGALEQARALAERMGYRLAEETPDSDGTWLELRFGRARPALTLFHSQPELRRVAG
jgi:hypothetical protein